jgi:hypothetical protein
VIGWKLEVTRLIRTFETVHVASGEKANAGRGTRVVAKSVLRRGMLRAASAQHGGEKQ